MRTLAPNYRVVRTQKDLRELIDWLKLVRLYRDPYERAFAFDTETYAPESNKKKLKQEALIIDRGRIMMLSIARRDQAWTVPTSAYDPKYLDTRLVLKALEPFFIDRSIAKVMHNANYDVNMVLNHGIKFNLRSIYCTLIAGNAWDETLPNSLKERCTLVGLRLKQTKTVDFTNEEEAAKYAAMDAVATWSIREGYERGRPVVVKSEKRNMLLKGTRRKFFLREMVILRSVIRMERRGFKINDDGIHKIDAKIVNTMDKIASRLYVKNGKPFNIGSTAQLGDFLYNKLNLDPPKTTPKGKPSCDKESLAMLRKQHPLVRKLTKYNAMRALRRFTSPDTGLFLYMDADKRIHTTFHQVGARTARGSSGNPNLQQIPSKMDIFGIRKCFVPEKGNVLIVADMDQLELRLMANFSRDPMMLKAYKNNISIHIQTGIKCGLLPVGVTKDMIKADPKLDRGYGISKNCNFGLMYEGTFWTLLRQLLLEGIDSSEEEVKEIIDQYWRVYAGVPLYRNWLYDQVRLSGYVPNICGRPYRIHGINSQVKSVRRAAERQAINTQIQGSGAELIKYSMMLADADEELKEYKCRMLLQVHDELLFECPEKYAQLATNRVKTIMETMPDDLIVKLAVPLTASANFGYSWAEAKH